MSHYQGPLVLTLKAFERLARYEVHLDRKLERTLVHRHRRMIHPTKLQGIENIREFPTFVNVPKESVH